MLQTIIVSIITVYVLAVVVCFLIGGVIKIASAEFGRDDIDYKTGAALLKYALLPPVAFHKAIVLRLEYTDKRKDKWE